MAVMTGGDGSASDSARAAYSGRAWQHGPVDLQCRTQLYLCSWAHSSARTVGPLSYKPRDECMSARSRSWLAVIEARANDVALPDCLGHG